MADPVVVIGAGPGGYASAVRAAQLGAQVSLVERERVGGTCLNWGCIPSKVMNAAAGLLDRLDRAGETGVQVSSQSCVDMEMLQHRLNGVIRNQREGILKLLKHNRVRYIQGDARAGDAHTVEVDRKDGESLELPWRRLILAPGSKPAEIPSLPFDGLRILSSNDVFQLTRIPQSLVIVGGGVIGCEFAFMFRAFGAHVTVVEAMSRILPLDSVDRDISKNVQREMKKRKIHFVLHRIVERAEDHGGGIRLTLQPPPWAPKAPKNETLQELACDTVLVCAGRQPPTDPVGLSRLQVKTDERGWILVDNRMETRAADVYAVGDVLGPSRPMVAHVAVAEGSAAAENALGGNRSMKYDAVPGTVFTFPEVGYVGFTEAQARKKGYAVRTEKVLYRNLGKAQAMGEIAGEAKVIWDGETGRILGVHLMGTHATELIAEATLAVRMGCTVNDLVETMHAHPTLAEAMGEVCWKAAGRPLHG